MSSEVKKQKKSGGYFKFIVKFVAIAMPIQTIDLLILFKMGQVSVTTMAILEAMFVILSLAALAIAKKIDKLLEMPEEEPTK